VGQIWVQSGSTKRLQRVADPVGSKKSA
jgi:hypothetical protein